MTNERATAEQIDIEILSFLRWQKFICYNMQTNCSRICYHWLTNPSGLV